MARSPKVYRVRITNARKTISCAANQTVLEAAVAAGIDYPYICASGNCGTCVSQLEEGRVVMAGRGDAALPPRAYKAGRRLACRSRPRSDLKITWLGE